MMVLIHHWSCKTNGEIAALTGYTEQQVSNIITSNEGQEILQQLSDQTLDSFGESNQMIQAAMPAIIDRTIQMALQTSDMKVATANCHKLMGITGLSEIKRLHVDMGDDTVNKYRDKSDDELRKQLLEEIGIIPPTQPTIH